MTSLLRIPGTPHSPELAFHANPTYALYQWLRANANQPAINDDRLRQAFQLVGRSFNRPGPRGMVAPWEEALANGETPDASLRAFQLRVQASGEDMVSAMRIAERIFMEEYWPERKNRIARALDGIRVTFAPAFAAMAKEHADLLDIDWPQRIDTHLVTDVAGHQGAYSHPLTIDVGHQAGLTLFETILHEATHVAEVNGRIRGHLCFGYRLQAYLAEHGLSPAQRFNIWHAVIFASSAACTRHHISLDHEDYAVARNLYAVFGVPAAAGDWQAFAESGRDERRLMEALLDDFRTSGASGR